MSSSPNILKRSASDISTGISKPNKIPVITGNKSRRKGVFPIKAFILLRV